MANRLRNPLEHTAEMLEELARAIEQTWADDDTDAEQCRLLHESAEYLRHAKRRLEKVNALYDYQERQTSLRFS